MALPRRWRWPSEGPDRRRDPLPSPGGAPCLRARRVSGRGLVLLAGERGGVMKPGLLLWRKDGFAVVTKVAGEWVQLSWLTGNLAGEKDEIDVYGVRSFRVVEKVTA